MQQDNDPFVGIPGGLHNLCRRCVQGIKVTTKSKRWSRGQEFGDQHRLFVYIHTSLPAMDSITHIVLGAAIGEIVAGRKLGKKAMLIGAIVQSLPDIDFLANFWLDTSHATLAHRGITHSFFFVLVMTPLLAWVAGRLWPRSGMTRRDWWLFFGLQLLVHI